MKNEEVENQTQKEKGRVKVKQALDERERQKIRREVAEKR